MKKIILVLAIIICNFSYSQKTTKSEKKYLINSSDFTTETTVSVKDKTFKFKAGDESLVDVSTLISSSKSQLDNLTIEKLNSILETSIDKTSYIVKNKSTYIPRKITAMFSQKDNGWLIIVEYSAKNDLGGTKDSKSFLSFNDKGDYLRTM